MSLRQKGTGAADERDTAAEGARAALREKLAAQYVADTERARTKMTDLNGPAMKHQIQQQVKPVLRCIGTLSQPVLATELGKTDHTGRPEQKSYAGQQHNS